MPEPARTQQSTNLAAVDPRILQANERTLLAWIRTAVGLMAFGFVIARMGLWLRHLEGDATSRLSVSSALGAAIVASGGIMTLAAAARYRRLRSKLLQGELPHSGPGLELAVAGCVAGTGLILAAYLVVR